MSKISIITSFLGLWLTSYLSDKNQNFNLKGKGYAGEYRNIFSNEKMDLTQEAKLVLKSWEYLVLSNK